MRLNLYAHVVYYLVLVDLKYAHVRDAFYESMCFYYNYYVMWGNHFVEARRELMQEFPKKNLFSNS